MPQTSRLGWLELAALAAMTVLGVTPSPSAAQAAATPAATTAANAPAAAAATPADMDAPFTQGKAADGATKAVVCASCHGPNGNSVNPDWPRLAGQSHDYMLKTMTDFKTGARANNPGMTDLMKGIADSDIAALATFIAGLQLQQ